MILLLVGSAKALSVENEHLDGLSIGRKAVDRFAPDPHALISVKKKLSTIFVRNADRNAMEIASIFAVTTTYLGAGINRVADVKATVTSKYHPVKEITLAGAVHTGN